MAQPITYTGRPEFTGATFKCKRCSREHQLPSINGAPVKCECGWWYKNANGRITEEFRPRLGIALGR